jgi:thiol-disulfide isomerase/thioredoxin
MNFKLLTVLALLIAPALFGGELRPFDAKSLTAIRETHAGRPFILAFWSIHCAPCKEEMIVLAGLKKKFPGVAIVLVATDPPSAKPAVTRYLATQKLGQIETWAFADEFAEKVRFAVDRKWHGELPRTYFFNAQHDSTAHSGVLDSATTEAWLKEQSAPKTKK